MSVEYNHPVSPLNPMKNAMIRTAAAAMVAASFGFTALAEEAKASPKTAKAAPAEASSSKVGKALDGKVIRIKDGKAVDTKLGDPKHYVFYHSASW